MSEPNIYEIERRFRLTELPPLVLSTFPSYTLKQGWLPGTRINERVQFYNMDKKPRFKRSIKYGQGVKRIEIDEEIPNQPEDRKFFDALWVLTHNKRIHKIRYHKEVDGQYWEVDAYQDRTLFMAEIELPNETAELLIPDWLSPYIIEEATGKPEFEGPGLGISSALPDHAWII